jgi:hypothetical protein
MDMDFYPVERIHNYSLFAVMVYVICISKPLNTWSFHIDRMKMFSSLPVFGSHEYTCNYCHTLDRLSATFCFQNKFSFIVKGFHSR